MTAETKVKCKKAMVELFLSILIGGISSVISSITFFMLSSMATVLSAKLDNALLLEINIPIIIGSLYISLLCALSIFFRKKKFVFVGIILHFIITPITWFVLFLYLSHYVLVLFKIQEIWYGEVMASFFVSVPIIIQFCLSALIAIIAVVIDRIILLAKTKRNKQTNRKK